MFIEKMKPTEQRKNGAMKLKAGALLFLLSFLFLPLNTFAKTYTIGEMSIDIDDTGCEVYTNNNPAVNDTSKTISEYMKNCEYIWIKGEAVNILVTAGAVQGNDFNSLNENELTDLKKATQKRMGKIGANVVGTLSINKNIYVRCQGYVNTSYMDCLSTLKNNMAYAIFIIKPTALTEDDQLILRNAVESVRFKESIFKTVALGIINGLIILGILEIITLLKRKFF